jgi:SOS-response transcriptional repressor LexA
VQSEGDLTAEEAACVDAWSAWFRMLETTALNRSYKMIVLRVLLDRDAISEGLPLEQLSLACRRHLQQHQVLSRDVSDQAGLSDAEWCAWWKKWPITRWLDDQSGTRWFRISNNIFHFHPNILTEHRLAFTRLTSELVDWRLAAWATSRGLAGEEGGSGVGFEASVSHVNGKPILFLPTVERVPGRPVGPVDVRLSDGQQWTFRCVKVACNVAAPTGTSGNQLPQLLKQWFGADAGLPGTQFRVRFRKEAELWLAEPVRAESLVTPATVPPLTTSQPPGFRRHLAAAEQYQSWVPVYDLSIAAGFWGPESTPEIQGWVPVTGRSIQPGMFVAQVHGESMQPRIPNASWCLFRPCPAGSREGRLLLVQLRTEASEETGGRYTVKRYHSEKTTTADGWEHRSIELQPINPDYPTIPLTAETAADVVINAEFIELLPPSPPPGESGRGVRGKETTG